VRINRALKPSPGILRRAIIVENSRSGGIGFHMNGLPADFGFNGLAANEKTQHRSLARALLSGTLCYVPQPRQEREKEGER
jgi:hypothetical protein